MNIHTPPEAKTVLIVLTIIGALCIAFAVYCHFETKALDAALGICAVDHYDCELKSMTGDKYTFTAVRRTTGDAVKYEVQR